MLTDHIRTGGLRPPHLPDRLWKYREWDKRGFARSLIVDGGLYFSTVAQLNDPFEFRWRHKFPLQPTEQRKLAVEMGKLHYPEAEKLKKKAMKEVVAREIRQIVKEHADGVGLCDQMFKQGVLCLTEVNDDILMWSHYADRHRGVCVGIQSVQLLKFQILRKVRYSDELPTLDVWAYIRDSRRFVELALTKAEHWQYECEWRTVDEPGLRFFPECVDQIVIGLNASTETKEEVISAAKVAPQKIEVLQAALSETRYGLDFKSIGVY